jgi:hypothetical protein
MRKLCVPTVALGISFGAFAHPVSAETIKTDAGLAGKKFCWSSGWHYEKYGRDHSYVYYSHVDYLSFSPLTAKGTWTISKDGIVTLELSDGSTKTRQYDMIDGSHVKELTGSLFNWRGAPGKLCY